jgi:hypothetical protein
MRNTKLGLGSNEDKTKFVIEIKSDDGRYLDCELDQDEMVQFATNCMKHVRDYALTKIYDMGKTVESKKFIAEQLQKLHNEAEKVAKEAVTIDNNKAPKEEPKKKRKVTKKK